MKRRIFIQHAHNAVALMGLGITPMAVARSSCAPTPSDYLGPFYVANTPVLKNINRFSKPGEPLRVTGRVLSADGEPQPIAGAIIEVWQTDGDGRYHPQGRGDASQYADADIDLRGQIIADAGGRFEFLTVVPGAYRPRPRHLHYRIVASGFKTLVTQHYLSDGEPVPGGACRSARIERGGDLARFQAPAFYLARQ